MDESVHALFPDLSLTRALLLNLRPGSLILQLRTPSPKTFRTAPALWASFTFQAPRKACWNCFLRLYLFI